MANIYRHEFFATHCQNSDHVMDSREYRPPGAFDVSFAGMKVLLERKKKTKKKKHMFFSRVMTDPGTQIMCRLDLIAYAPFPANSI